MANENLPPLDFSGADAWERPSGGQSSQLLSHNGDFAVTIADAVPGKSKSSDNYQVVFTLVVQDDDNKGKKMFAYVPYTGMARSDPPRPNAHRLFEVLDSSGTTKDKFQKLSQVGKMDISQICDALKNKVAYVNCKADKYEKTGNWSSKPNFFMTKDRYEANRAINAHRTALPVEAQAWAGQRGGVAVAVPSGNGTQVAAGQATPAPQTASQAATDLL